MPTEALQRCRGHAGRFPRRDAVAVAREIVNALRPACERLIVAGSLRRRKASVGDVEILYVPKFTSEPDGLFDTKQVNLADVELDQLLLRGELVKRLNVHSVETWGQRNKLAVHTASGIPVDLFATIPAAWTNYLVHRTGSAFTNTRIAAAALRKGWFWKPYTAGFINERGELVPVTEERDVFTLVGLPYLEPWQR